MTDECQRLETFVIKPIEKWQRSFIPTLLLCECCANIFSNLLIISTERELSVCVIFQLPNISEKLNYKRHMCENPKVFIQPEPEFPALTSSVLSELWIFVKKRPP